ncbi:uncharacterized protein HD556DRAFT_1474552 [Suillus plorans]|uniref:Protein transport protein SFT2 n=1 Tax=Suillus plorans TaxID=116603 RepID=A0A9P7AQQ8_9AGAM|nr:uncharacterized protein HD556DRAFT_1474552 [Suillus plorans]KAG1794529.1 hypothetical protein HD556DRAFT_1474552 [Suillus plorans]
MPSSSEQSFRANLSQFCWARGVIDNSQQTQQPLSSSNLFSHFYNAVAGNYIPLRSSEHSNGDEAWFALSRWERLLGFGACLLLGAAVCFFVAFMTLPFLTINPAKFALAFRYAGFLSYHSVSV